MNLIQAPVVLISSSATSGLISCSNSPPLCSTTKLLRRGSSSLTTISGRVKAPVRCNLHRNSTFLSPELTSSRRLRHDQIRPSRAPEIHSLF
ncbi:hypothetical protein Bca4012_020236 [Brassica carinata]|uniref:Uncharacterized protein n=1 Tax=Brassica carinata TaxID=52824 RepID=A0A8X8B9P6_BRACI|nr:hypothetical protein Bca52824_001354 [Brassica carinata]